MLLKVRSYLPGLLLEQGTKQGGINILSVKVTGVAPVFWTGYWLVERVILKVEWCRIMKCCEGKLNSWWQIGSDTVTLKDVSPSDVKYLWLSLLPIFSLWKVVLDNLIKIHVWIIITWEHVNIRIIFYSWAFFGIYCTKIVTRNKNY